MSLDASATIPPEPLTLDGVLRAMLDRFDQADRHQAEGHVALVAHVDRVAEVLSARIDTLGKRLDLLEQEKDRRHATHDRHFAEVLADLAAVKHALQAVTNDLLEMRRRVDALEERASRSATPEIVSALSSIERALRERPQ